MTKPHLLPGRRAILRRALTGVALVAAGPIVLAAGAQAAAPPALKLTEKDRGDLRRVETYLNGIRTLQARFQQFAQNAGLSWGTIYLRRPGMLRVEYEPPVPVLLVSDGVAVSYYDSELDQLNQVPLGSSPLWFLLRDPISFDDSVTITAVDRRPGALRLRMYQTDEPNAGTVTLIFSDDPLELKNWTIVDATGKEITIGLYNVSIGGQLANNLFATPSPRKQGGTNK